MRHDDDDVVVDSGLEQIMVVVSLSFREIFSIARALEQSLGEEYEPSPCSGWLPPKCCLLLREDSVYSLYISEYFRYDEKRGKSSLVASQFFSFLTISIKD